MWVWLKIKKVIGLLIYQGCRKVFRLINVLAGKLDWLEPNDVLPCEVLSSFTLSPSLWFILPFFFQRDSKVEPIVENGNSFPEPKTVPAENGSLTETQDSDAVSGGFCAVSVYDQWVAPPVSGPRPKARYEVVSSTRFFHFSKLFPL